MSAALAIPSQAQMLEPTIANAIFEFATKKQVNLFSRQLQQQRPDGTGLYGTRSNDIFDTPDLNDAPSKMHTKNNVPYGYIDENSVRRSVKNPIPSFYDIKSSQEEIHALRDPYFVPSKYVNLDKATDLANYLRLSNAHASEYENRFNTGLVSKVKKSVDVIPAVFQR